MFGFGADCSTGTNGVRVMGEITFDNIDAERQINFSDTELKFEVHDLEYGRGGSVGTFGVTKYDVDDAANELDL